MTPFRGIQLQEMLAPYYPVTREALQKAILVVAAADGYQCVFTFSEVTNRNDQSEVLVIEEGKDQGGLFRLFPSADFFSDRAVKAAKELRYLTVN